MGGQLGQFIHFRQHGRQFRNATLDMENGFRIRFRCQHLPQLPQALPQRGSGLLITFAQFQQGHSLSLPQRMQWQPG